MALCQNRRPARTTTDCSSAVTPSSATRKPHPRVPCAEHVAIAAQIAVQVGFAAPPARRATSLLVASTAWPSSRKPRRVFRCTACNIGRKVSASFSTPFRLPPAKGFLDWINKNFVAATFFGSHEAVKRISVSYSLASASRKHCSKIPSAQSICSLSMMSAGDMRIVFSPEPSNSKPL